MTTPTRKPRPLLVYTLDTLLAKTEEVGDCLEWTGGYTGNGHPCTKHNGKAWMVRRLVLRLKGIEIKPAHVVVPAKCDNLRCINPEHQVQRSERQHMKVMGLAGGQSDHLRSAKIAATKRARGQARLTEDQVREIRASTGTLRELSAIYGVNKSRICGIRLGRMWKDFSNPFAGLIRGAA